LTWISLDALAGRVRGRGHVHESEATWELVEKAIEPFRSDLDRRAALGLLDAAADLAVGIVAGFYWTRVAEEGTVLAYAGEDMPVDLASEVLDLAERLAVTAPATLPRRTSLFGPTCGDRTDPMSGGTGEAGSYGVLLAEVEVLRAENLRLRGLLGLDERTDDGHAKSWAPTLLTEQSDRPSVDAASTAADKLALSPAAGA